MSAIQQGLRSDRAASTPDETDSSPGGEDPGPAPAGVNDERRKFLVKRVGQDMIANPRFPVQDLVSR
jgi:hypothetical protein